MADPREHKVYPLSMTPELYGLIQAAARREGESMASWIRQAIREKLGQS